LHIGQEDGHTDAAEAFGNDLQAHGFSGAGSARDHAVTVAHAGQQEKLTGTLGDEDGIGHAALLETRNGELETPPLALVEANEKYLRFWRGGDSGHLLSTVLIVVQYAHPYPPVAGRTGKCQDIGCVIAPLEVSLQFARIFFAVE